MTNDNARELDGKMGKRLEHKLQIVEKRDRILIKDRSSDRAVFEEVFDKSTVMTLYNLLNLGVIEKIFGVVKSGKESRIYRGVDAEGNDIALKIYLTVAVEFKKMLPYIQGDPRFTRTKRSKRSLIYAWAQKEFKNLQRAFAAGIAVPKPIHVKKNVLIMEFMGSGNTPLPTIKDNPPKNLTMARKMYSLLLQNVRLLYHKAGLVHGDLSEYNIMNKAGIPIIFDMSQAVLIDHPNAEEFLLRDLTNLNRFFQRRGIKVKEIKKLYTWVIKGES
jgi:RIO kinase 1